MKLIYENQKKEVKRKKSKRYRLIFFINRDVTSPTKLTNVIQQYRKTYIIAKWSLFQ
jgi:hypothetical protein